MARDVETLIKLKDTDPDSINSFFLERISNIFGKARSKKINENTNEFTALPSSKSYGIKAKLCIEPTSDQYVLVKLSARPAISTLGIVMAVINVILILLGFVGLVFCFFIAFGSIFMARREQKAITQKLQTLLDELKIRFS